MRGILSLSLAAAALAACDSAAGPDDPGPPAYADLVAGQAQTGAVALPLADSLRIRVLDEDGRPVPGAAVQFVVTQGGGAVSPATATADAAGRVAAAWTLGTLAGPGQTVEARATGAGAAVLVLATFSAVAQPGPAATLILSGAPAASLAAVNDTVRLAASIRDAHQNLRADPVDWGSLDADVAVVTATGLTIAVGNGTARIVARSGAVSDTVSISVRQTAHHIDWTPVGTVSIPEIFTVNAWVEDRNGFRLAVQPTLWFTPPVPIVVSLGGYGSFQAFLPGTADIEVWAEGTSIREYIPVSVDNAYNYPLPCGGCGGG